MKPYTMRSRTGGVQYKIQLTSGTYGQSLDWLLVFISFTGLMFIAKFGGIGALIFLMPWGIVVLTKPQAALTAILRNAWVFALPLLCFVSAFWSDFPQASIRSAIQFLLTIAIGILAGECIRPKVFASSLFGALACAAVASLVSGSNGIFESKNQLAQLGVFFALVALSIVLDRSQPRLLRYLSGARTMLGLSTILAGNSAGSTVCSIPAILAAPLLMALSFLPGAVRITFFFLWASSF
jgi:exopolysaccharide production protein ExoQ